MTEQEIVNKALAIVLKVNKDSCTRKDKQPLGIHDLYKESIDMAEAISYHSVKGKFPEKLFSNRSPNETIEESKYIKANYKQYTLPEFIDYLSTITRPFGDGNWSINYSEEEQKFVQSDKTFQSYVENELPIYGSLETFIKSILPNIKSIDANGFLSIRPKEIDYIQNENAEIVIDSTELYKPTIFYFESKNVIKYKADSYYLFLSKEKSEIKYGNKNERAGNIFELYTKEAVYLFIQTGNKTENTFRTELFYQHNAGKCPVTQLKGIPNLSGDEILWQSPFLFGCDLLDCVTVNLNWLQFITNKCVFPMTVMLGSTCEFRNSEGVQCDGGSLFVEGNKTTCPSCKGVGKVGRLSPLGTLLINPATKFDEGEVKSTQAPLSYISPDVTTLLFIESKAESDRQKSRQILHLQTSNSKVKGTENLTATGMALDNKAMTAFVKPIIDQIFNIYEWALNTIGIQRYGADFVHPELSYPKSYDFKNPEDYLRDLTNAITNNLPPAFIQTLLFQYINSFYGDNNKTTLIFKLVISADRLFGLSQEEINMKLARGTVAKWEDILHSSVLSFINEIILTDFDFLNKDKTIQKQLLVDKAKQTQADIEGKPIDDLMTALLPDAAGSRLKDSVGGLTGMIEIAKAVASGLYDLEAAVALVQDRFGLTEEMARKQLGTPSLIKSEADLNLITALT